MALRNTSIKLAQTRVRWPKFWSHQRPEVLVVFYSNFHSAAPIYFPRLFLRKSTSGGVHTSANDIYAALLLNRSNLTFRYEQKSRVSKKNFLHNAIVWRSYNMITVYHSLLCKFYFSQISQKFCFTSLSLVIYDHEDTLYVRNNFNYKSRAREEFRIDQWFVN